MSFFFFLLILSRFSQIKRMTRSRLLQMDQHHFRTFLALPPLSLPQPWSGVTLRSTFKEENSNPLFINPSLAYLVLMRKHPEFPHKL